MQTARPVFFKLWSAFGKNYSATRIAHHEIAQTVLIAFASIIQP
jgi:hypothetical protein